MTLLVKDYTPTAHDDASYMSTITQSNGEVLGQFSTTASGSHEGWVVTQRASSEVQWGYTIPSACQPGIFSAATVARVQSEYGVTLNSGLFGNGNVGLRLKAESRTQVELSTTVNYSVIEALVTNAGGRITGYPSGTTNRDMTLAAHEVVSRGGEILVSWGLHGNTTTSSGSQKDGCVYILMDEYDHVVAQGVYFLPVGANNGHGIWSINVPDTGIAQTYKLVIGSFDGGTSTSSVDSVMYVDSVLQLNNPEFAGLVHEGNVIKDVGVDGMVDEAFDNAMVGEVVYNNVAYQFAAGQNVIIIETPEGKLYVGRNGEYLFKPSSPDGSFSGDEFSYRLVDQDGDWSGTATVHLAASDEASPAPVAYDDVARTEGNKLVGNVLTDPGLGGSIDFASEAAIVAAFIYNGTTYPILPSPGYREITTDDGGKLRVERDGDYSYTPAAGHSLSGVMDHFEYIVNDGSGADSATVYLYSDDMRTNGTVGDDLIDQNGTVMPGMISGGAGDDLILGGAGNGILDGGTGNDVLVPASLQEDDAAAIRVDLLTDGLISDQDAQAIANLLDTLPDGKDGDYLMYGGAGNDALLGGSGNDTLHGGAGNDFLFGGRGDDFLDGGSGANALYGGEGNDIMVFHADNTVMDGGNGVDVLIGVDLADTQSLDALFTGEVIRDVEVIMGAAPSLTNMDGLEALGITVSDNGISLSDAWQAATSAPVSPVMADAGYEAFSNDEGLTILVLKNALENGG
jgi:Ca2+-binding RTX toxin-like protein